MAIKHLLAVVACAALATTAGAQVAKSKAGGNAAAGQAKAAVCGACHGADGNNAPEIFAALKAPKLAGQVPEYIAKSLHDFKAGRRVNDSMTPQAQNVAEADIADIAAYYGAQKATANPSANKDLLALGEKIFFKGTGRPNVVAACVGCHGLNGVGNRSWSEVMTRQPTVLAPAIGGQHAAYLADQLKAYKAGKRTTDVGRVMRDIAGRLDDKEILAVAEYLSTLKH